eukprot:PhF_6_TR22567/c0_g1_i1/m.32135/K04739/PRKAR; cAMP-dependent protein kinase regulator
MRKLPGLNTLSDNPRTPVQGSLRPASSLSQRKQTVAKVPGLALRTPLLQSTTPKSLFLVSVDSDGEDDEDMQASPRGQQSPKLGALTFGNMSPRSFALGGPGNMSPRGMSRGGGRDFMGGDMSPRSNRMLDPPETPLLGSRRNLATPSLSSTVSVRMLSRETHSQNVLERQRLMQEEQKRKVEEEAEKREQQRETANREKTERPQREFLEQSCKMWLQIIYAVAPTYLLFEKCRKQKAGHSMKILLMPMLLRFVRVMKQRRQDKIYNNEMSRSMVKPTVEKLQSNAFFQGWRPANIGSLIHGMFPKCIRAGMCVMLDGDWGNEMYMLDSGTVEVLIRKKDKKDKRRCKENGVVVATLHAPAFFGEFALLADEPRSASIVCVTDVQLWVISRTNFNEQMDQLPPSVKQRLCKIAEDRRASNLLQLYKMRPEQLLQYKMFESWDTESLLALIKHIKPRLLKPGNVIFREGQKGDNLYWLAKGSAIVAKKNTQATNEIKIRLDDEVRAALQPNDVVIHVMHKGSMFGQTAVLFSEGRTATVIAVEPSEAWYISKEDLIDTLMMFPDRFLKAKEATNADRASRLTKLPVAAYFGNYVVDTLSKNFIKRLHELLIPVSYGPTDCIIADQTSVDMCLFALSGRLCARIKEVSECPQVIGLPEVFLNSTAKSVIPVRAITRVDGWKLLKSDLFKSYEDFPDDYKKIRSSAFQTQLVNIITGDGNNPDRMITVHPIKGYTAQGSCDLSPPTSPRGARSNNLTVNTTGNNTQLRSTPSSSKLVPPSPSTRLHVPPSPSNSPNGSRKASPAPSPRAKK